MSNWAIKIKGKMCRSFNDIDDHLRYVAIDEYEFDDYGQQLLNMCQSTDITPLEAIQIQGLLFQKYFF